MIKEVEVTREELIASSPSLDGLSMLRLDRMWIFYDPLKTTEQRIKKIYYDKQKQTTKQQAKESLSDGWYWE